MNLKAAIITFLHLWPIQLYMLTFVLLPLSLWKYIYSKISLILFRNTKRRKAQKLIVYDKQRQDALIMSKFVKHQKVAVVVEGTRNGRALVKELVQRGYRVIVARFRNSEPLLVQQQKIIRLIELLKKDDVKPIITWIVLDISAPLFETCKDKVIFVDPMNPKTITALEYLNLNFWLYFFDIVLPTLSFLQSFTFSKSRLWVKQILYHYNLEVSNYLFSLMFAWKNVFLGPKLVTIRENLSFQFVESQIPFIAVMADQIFPKDGYFHLKNYSPFANRVVVKTDGLFVHDDEWMKQVINEL